VKPIFLIDQDAHGSVKPPRTQWLTNVEIYMAIGSKVPSECIKGIQRRREMWRIYMDNEGDRLSLLVQGINLRGRQVPLHSQNPHNPSRLQPDTIRIKVKNIPLSADDGQIHRVLTLEGCEIQGLFRERLHVKGKLTNCETGDRLVICKVLKKPIPRNLHIGKYLGKIFHSGQPEFQNRNPDERAKACHKCLKPGHLIYECPNDCKLTKAVVLNSFPHGRFWQFVYKENVRCTRLMQRSLQVLIRQMFVLCSLKIEAQWSEPMSFTFHSALRKLNTD
jgi:hypothetical protein